MICGAKRRRKILGALVVHSFFLRAFVSSLFKRCFSFADPIASARAAGETPPPARKGPSMRGLVALASMMLLSACTGMLETPWLWQADYPQPEFGVTALKGDALPPGQAMFNRTGTEPIDQHAAQVCTQGYQKVTEQPLPADVGEFQYAQIACNPYRPNFAFEWPH
jgi:hypothetical protein